MDMLDQNASASNGSTSTDLIVVPEQIAAIVGTEAVKIAQKLLPLNGFGLPEGFYRPDTLMNLLSIEADSDGNINPDILTDPARLQSAYVRLNYTEGFPALPSGRPFWAQLDFESSEAFASFEIYTAQKVRQVYFMPEICKVLAPDLKHLQPQDFLEYFHTNYWHYRSRSYDLFDEAVRRKERHRRAINVQDEHFRIADKLLRQIEPLFEDPEFLGDVSPKVAGDLLSKLVTIQRISIGLPANGPGGSNVDSDGIPKPEDSAPAGAPMEIIMRSISSAQNGDAGQGNQALDSANVERRKILFDKTLNDPATAHLAQELIIRLNTKALKIG